MLGDALASPQLVLVALESARNENRVGARPSVVVKIWRRRCCRRRRAPSAMPVKKPRMVRGDCGDCSHAMKASVVTSVASERVSAAIA
jgi:hypothetical protein